MRPEFSFFGMPLFLLFQRHMQHPLHFQLPLYQQFVCLKVIIKTFSYIQKQLYHQWIKQNAKTLTNTLLLEKTRLSYPARFKTQVIKDRGKGRNSAGWLRSFKFLISQRFQDGWNKKVILKAAASEDKRLLNIHQSIKYNSLLDQLNIVMMHVPKDK